MPAEVVIAPPACHAGAAHDDRYVACTCRYDGQPGDRPCAAAAAPRGQGPALDRSRVQALRRRHRGRGRIDRRSQGRHPLDHRPQRRRQDVAAQHDLRLLQAGQRAHHARRPRHHAPAAEQIAALGRRAHVPEHRAVRRPDRARQPHARPPRAHALGRAEQRPLLGPGAARGDRAPRGVRGDHRVPEAAGPAQAADGRARLRPAQARGAGPRAGARAQDPAARRAHGRHEPGREGGHGALRAGREPGARRHGRAHRARHGRGHGHLRPRRRARSRPQDCRRLAGRGAEQPRRHRGLSRHQKGEAAT